jgi:hypothetical protein
MKKLIELLNEIEEKESFTLVNENPEVVNMIPDELIANLGDAHISQSN